MWFLGNDSKTRLQPVEAPLPVIHAVNQDAALGGFVKTAKQFRDGTLAASRFADQGDAFPGANPEIEIHQHRSAPRIRECRAIENDLVNPADRSVGMDSGPILDLDNGLQETEATEVVG